MLKEGRGHPRRPVGTLSWPRTPLIVDKSIPRGPFVNLLKASLYLNLRFLLPELSLQRHNLLTIFGLHEILRRAGARLEE